MLRVLFDSKSHQAIRQRGTELEHYGEPPRLDTWRGRRLAGLETALASRGYAMEITDLQPGLLDDACVLVISGRSQDVPFYEGEMAVITTFFGRGGSVFLMGNHQGFVAPQNQVAQALSLPVTFHDVWVKEVDQRLALDSSHPISQDCGHGLKIRTSCSMTVEQGPAVAVLCTNEDPDVGTFAAAIERTEASPGRVVVITSGGHISSHDDSGTDLLSAASNETWTLNAIAWLAGRLPK